MPKTTPSLFLALYFCFVVGVVLMIASPGVNADVPPTRKLEQHCAGRIHRQLIRWSDPATPVFFFRGSEKATRLVITCISHMIAFTNRNESMCDPATILSSSRLYVNAVELNSDRNQNVDKTREYAWDINRVIGGSVDSVRYSTPNPSQFTLRFRNEHDNMCDMELFFVVEYYLETETTLERKDPEPGLVEITPMTAYINRSTLFTFKLEDRAYPTDRVAVLRMPASCKNFTHVYESKFMSRADDDQSLEPHDEEIRKSTWSHVFQEGGSYKLCYKHGDLEFEEIAQMTVFGTNPQYFVAGNPGQHLYLNTPIPFRFFGTGLNRADGGDEAKLVFWRFSCEEGPPSGGVAPSKNLGPDDNPSAVMSEYTVIFREPGRFRVCYKRRATSKWVEIPSLEDLPKEVNMPILTPAPQTSRPPLESPVLTYAPTSAPTVDPTSAGCRETAPPRSTYPTKSTLLVMQVNTARGKGVGHSFWTRLADVLCVPASAIQQYAMNRVDGQTDAVSVSWGLSCMLGDQMSCDERERMDYAIYLFTEKITTYGPMFGVTKVFEMEKGIALSPVTPKPVVDDHPTQDYGNAPAYKKKWHAGHHDASSSKGWMIAGVVIGGVLVLILGGFLGLAYMGRHGYAMPMQAIRNMLGGNNNNGNIFDDEESGEMK
eukprot:PhM_4_TR323/c0_g1_i1/m.10302